MYKTWNETTEDEMTEDETIGDETTGIWYKYQLKFIININHLLRNY